MNTNQLTTKEAIQNLQNLINAALRGGLFTEPDAVFAVQASLNLVAQTIQQHAQMNGIGKKEPVLQDEGVS